MADGTFGVGETPFSRPQPTTGEVAFGPPVAGGPASATLPVTIEHILAFLAAQAPGVTSQVPPALAAQVFAAQAAAAQAQPARPTSPLAGPLYMLGVLAVLFFAYHVWSTWGGSSTPSPSADIKVGDTYARAILAGQADVWERAEQSKASDPASWSKETGEAVNSAYDSAYKPVGDEMLSRFKGDLPGAKAFAGRLSKGLRGVK